jgi:peptidoglycan/LPS O-acetylase OafA/YrhL
MILTIGALVRAFAGMIMTERMSRRHKQLAVLGISVALFIGLSISTEPISFATVFAACISGLTAGLVAMGIHAQKDTSATS